MRSRRESLPVDSRVSSRGLIRAQLLLAEFYPGFRELDLLGPFHASFQSSNLPFSSLDKPTDIELSILKRLVGRLSRDKSSIIRPNSFLGLPGISWSLPMSYGERRVLALD